MRATFVCLLLTNVGFAASLPNDFSEIQGTNGFYYELIGDSRATNTMNPGVGIELLTFHGPVGGQLLGLPTYGHATNYPFVQIDVAAQVIPMHPGTGGFLLGTGTANLGTSVRYQSSSSGIYRIVGGFARDNELFGEGNGVDVLATTGSLDTPVFSANIGSSHVVDTASPFAGTGVANFDLTLPLLAGESVRFVVFADGQGQDGTFDATAFRVSINAVPEPSAIVLLTTGLTCALGFCCRKMRKLRTFTPRS